MRRPDEVYQQRERFRRVVGALLRLPPKQRQVIVRHALDGDSHERIGTELGMSAGSIRQLVHRARRTLRETAAALLPTPLLRSLPMGGDAAELAGGTALAKVALAVMAAGAAGGGALQIVEHQSEKPAVAQTRKARERSNPSAPVRSGPGAHGAGAGRGRCPGHRLAEARLVGAGVVGARTRAVRRFRGRIVRVRFSRLLPRWLVGLVGQRFIGLAGQRLIGLVRVFWLFRKWIIRVRRLGLRRGFAGVRLIRQRLLGVRLVRQRLIRQRLIRQRLIRQRLIRQRLIRQRLIRQRLIRQRLIRQRLLGVRLVGPGPLGVRLDRVAGLGLVGVRFRFLGQRLIRLRERRGGGRVA